MKSILQSKHSRDLSSKHEGFVEYSHPLTPQQRESELPHLQEIIYGVTLSNAPN